MSYPIHSPLRTEPRPLLWAAFAAVYLIWGSTYLAIRFAIETLPPLTMSGMRFLVAGGLLSAALRVAGRPAATPGELRAAAAAGLLMLLGGNGAVTWAEQTVPSGVAALLAALTPATLVLMEWACGGGRPGGRVLAGALLGIVGMAILAGPEQLLGAAAVDRVGSAAIVLGTLSWSAGSLYARGRRLPASPLTSAAAQMLSGGAALLAAGVALGELRGFEPAAVTLASLLAWAYLVVYCSILAFAAYIYLLTNTSAARASTYAFVNPLIAVLLGWLLAGEALDKRVLAGVASIVPAVLLIVSPGRSGAESAAAGVPPRGNGVGRRHPQR